MHHTRSERLRAWLLRLTTLVLVLLAVAFTGLRLLVAAAPEFRQQTEQQLSQALGQPLRLGGLRAVWDGLNPAVVLEDVELFAEPGEPPLQLDELELTLSLWQSLTRLELRPAEVAVEGLRVTLTRHQDGRLEAKLLGRSFPLGAPGQEPRRPLPPALRLREGAVTLVDAVTGQRHHIPRLDVLLSQHGDRRQLALSAELPPGLGSELQLSAGWSGRGEQLSADAYLHGRDLELQTLSAFLPADWPRLQGQGDVAAWAELRQGEPELLTAELQGRALASADGEVQLGDLGGRVHWRATDQGWELRADELGPPGAEAVRTALQAEYRAEGGAAGLLRAAVDRVVLEQWRPLAALLPPGRARELLTQARPSGTLAAVGLRLRHREREVTDLQLEAGLAGIAVEAVGRAPGLSGLNGRVQLDEHGGYAEIEGYRGAVALPRLFRQPLPFERLRGEAHWRYDDQGWSLTVPKLALISAGASAEAALGLRGRHGERPFVQLRAQLADGDVRQAGRYLPTGIMPPKVVEWLDTALQGGRVRQAQLLYFGPGRGFPYRDGQGVFEVRAEVEDAVLAYRPGWPEIKGLDASLRFSGPGMEIRAHRGQISGASLEPTVARVENLRGGDLVVQGGARPSGAQLLRFLRDSPLADGLEPTLAELSLEGQHPLQLKLAIPLRRGSGGPVLDGRLALQQGRLSWPQHRLVLENLTGAVRFDRDGLHSDGLRALFQGQPLELTAATSGRGAEAQIELHTALEIEPAALMPQPPHWLQGRSHWQLSARLPGFRSERAPGANITAESDLRGLALALPAPVAKPAAAELPFRLQTRIDGQGLHPVYFRYGERLRGVAQWQDGELARGTVRLGQGVPRLPEGRGFALTGSIERLDLDPWRALGDAAGAASSPVLRRLDLEVGMLQLFGRSFERVRAEGERDPAGWQLRLAGPQVRGAVDLPAKPEYGPIRLDLQRLQLGPAERGGAGLAASPRDVPAVDVAIDSLAVEGRELGSLYFVGRRAADGLVVDGLRLHAPWLTASGSLRWLEAEQGSRTELNLNLRAEDTGAALARLGLPRSIEDGATEGEAALSWPGGPAQFELARLRGQLALTIKDGRIPSVEPGPGRIFGLLGSLDVTDLFREGFAFDRIKLRLKLADGDAYPQVFRIDGPAARIAFAGRIGLAARDYDQLVTVTPQVSSTLPVLGGLAAGPLGAAAAYVAQRLLKDKINRLTEYQYKVTGPWAEPRVQRIARREREAADAAQGDGS